MGGVGFAARTVTAKDVGPELGTRTWIWTLMIAPTISFEVALIPVWFPLERAPLL